MISDDRLITRTSCAWVLFTVWPTDNSLVFHTGLRPVKTHSFTVNWHDRRSNSQVSVWYYPTVLGQKLARSEEATRPWNDPNEPAGVKSIRWLKIQTTAETNWLGSAICFVKYLLHWKHLCGAYGWWKDLAHSVMLTDNISLNIVANHQLNSLDAN